MMSASARSLAFALALVAFSFIEAAQAQEPFFGIDVELDAKASTKLRRNSATALGEGNNIYWAQGFESTAAAQKAVIRDCNLFIDRIFKRTNSRTCRLVTSNGKIVWEGKRPAALGSEILPLPDKALAAAFNMGNPATADAILLVVHGCDRPLSTPPHWVMSWFRYFLARNIAVIQPNSFADGHTDFCDTPVSFERDKKMRRRVAQTTRTVKILREKYPGKKMYLWGHSQGGRIVQFHDFGADAVIISGDVCWYEALSPKTPVLLVLGELDTHVQLGKKWQRISSELIKKHCPKFAKHKNWKFVVAAKTDHYVAIWHQNVIDSVSKLLGVKSYNLAFETWNDLIPIGVREAKARYDSGSMNKALAIFPGTNSIGYWVAGSSSVQDAEQLALSECERGSSLLSFRPGVTRACKLIESK